MCRPASNTRQQVLHTWYSICALFANADYIKIALPISTNFQIVGFSRTILTWLLQRLSSCLRTVGFKYKTKDDAISPTASPASTANVAITVDGGQILDKHHLGSSHFTETLLSGAAETPLRTDFVRCFSRGSASKRQTIAETAGGSMVYTQEKTTRNTRRTLPVNYPRCRLGRGARLKTKTPPAAAFHPLQLSTSSNPRHDSHQQRSRYANTHADE